MKPTVISNTTAASGAGSPQNSGNGISIPINHELRGQPNAHPMQQPQYHTQAQHYVTGEPQVTAYGSPNSTGRPPQQHHPHPHPQQPMPAHFQQDFDFEPDMDMFPRSRLGRMTHDPFGDFGGTTHFGFPQFNSLGRRRINPHNEDDFFNRLPSEFRQYIPESFGQRRGGPGMAASPGTGSPVIQPQHSSQHHSHPQYYNTMPQSPTKKVCDAAIQTEDPVGHSEVDHAINMENLNQHGLRNTMDMGVKSPMENENHGARSSSAPPTEQQQQQNQQQQQQYYPQSQQIPVNSPNRKTSPPQQQQFGTQTSPQVQTSGYVGQSPQFPKGYYAPTQQAHHQHQQKQQTPPPPQTPGGSYVRTIPIFVEGRSEPIINNKEIPNQTTQANTTTSSANSRAFTPPRQQTHRPTPLNTQQEQPTLEQQQNPSGGLPPQTPHTVDTINKIQDIQRDVLDLMSRVEKFSGTRADKEYVFLDEMLTRNLLKLDNIDTNGKESIRLARKEAIKCIQASINVLEAKAEENKKCAEDNVANKNSIEETNVADPEATAIALIESEESLSSKEITKEEIIPETLSNQSSELNDPKTRNEPIPLPPPESQKFNEVKIEDCPEDDTPTLETCKETPFYSENKENENTSEPI